MSKERFDLLLDAQLEMIGPLLPESKCSHDNGIRFLDVEPGPPENILRFCRRARRGVSRPTRCSVPAFDGLD